MLNTPQNNEWNVTMIQKTKVVTSSRQIAEEDDEEEEEERPRRRVGGYQFKQAS